MLGVGIPSGMYWVAAPTWGQPCCGGPGDGPGGFCLERWKGIWGVLFPKSWRNPAFHCRALDLLFPEGSSNLRFGDP